MAVMIDMKDKVIDYWTVLHRMPTRKGDGQKAVYWKCRCKCGTIKEISGVNLRKGCTRSCGCSIVKPEEFIGQKMGSLTVLERADIPPTEERFYFLTVSHWKVQCECGNIFIIARPQITNTNRAQRWHCGCLEISDKGKHKYTKVQKVLNILTDEQKTNILELTKQGFGEIKTGEKLNIDPYFVRKFIVHNKKKDHYDNKGEKG